ncbi:Bestrophin [Ancylostoma duodenale]|uniref:Bestrophin homolog n=1 Tax=Ancylostoma duodenale TaxID=51022 RepID=A0A0C2HER3_9BILA|nr:Bestrophin [Ancylostoma duodenale]
MTVTYSLDVANSSFFCLYRLLFRWKYRPTRNKAHLLWRTAPQRPCGAAQELGVAVFEDLCVFFDTYSSFIPITFMLGFYVSAVFTRWWQIFDNIGWIDTPALWITQYVRGQTERARMLRRTIIRYLVLTQAIVFRDVAAGLMTEKELEEFDSVISLNPKYWVPMHWVFSLIRVAKEEGKIPGEMVYVDFMEVFNHPSCHRGKKIFLQIDLYVPVMSILQFIFFVGWMKVAEVLLNPLGEDDDDFECNYILDRNLEVGFNVVDKAYDRFPNLVRDQFWEDSIPEPLYTAESAQRTINPQVGSCVDMATEDDSYMLRPRRRTISRSSHWDGEFGTEDVVPVIGMDRIKENNRSRAYTHVFEDYI